MPWVWASGLNILRVSFFASTPIHSITLGPRTPAGVADIFILGAVALAGAAD
jgi:hypothetical protein